MAVGRWVALAAWGFGVPSAGAAEVTDMPAELGVLGSATYRGSRLDGGLEEDGIRVGDRRFLRHDALVHLEFAPLEGLALTVEADATPAMQWEYPGGRTMLLDPLTGTGTYLTESDRAATEDTGPSSPETGTTATTGTTTTAPAKRGAPGFEAGGLNGIWFGVAAAPFSQLYKRHQAANWRLDLAFRTGSAKHSLWTYNGDRRGSSPGGTALRVAGAFSSDYGVGEPYLTAEWLKENKVKVDVLDANGAAVAKGLEVRPGSTLSSTGGVEIVAWEALEKGHRVAFDLSGTFGYKSWADVATGVYLPDTLPIGERLPVTTSEHVFARFGLGFDVHAARHFRAKFGTNATFRTPYRLEHLYSVYTTPDSWELGWFFTLGGTGAVAGNSADPPRTE